MKGLNLLYNRQMYILKTSSVMSEIVLGSKKLP